MSGNLLAAPISPGAPIVDPATGTLTDAGFRFLLALWQRTGTGAGVDSAVVRTAADTARTTASGAASAVTAETARAEAAEALLLPLSGGTMTGPLVLGGAPTSALQAADKGYVDAASAAAAQLSGAAFTGPVTAPSFWAGPCPFVDWLGLYAYGDSGTAVMGLSAAGNVGVAGASRADLAASGGNAPIGVLGFGFADGTGAKASFPAWGGYFEARKYPGSTGYAHGVEIDVTNLSGSTVALQPYNMFQTGGTNALWLGSGGSVGVGSPVYRAYDPATGLADLSAPVAASCAIGIINNGAAYQTGILFECNAIAGTDGASGSGVAIGMGMGHAIEWYTPNGTIAGQIVSTAVTASPPFVSMQFNDAGLSFNNASGASLLSINTVAAQITAGYSFGSVGAISGTGYNCRSGTAGAFGTSHYNIYWDGARAQLWIDTTDVGDIATTAYVASAIAGATAGVSSVVGSTGAVTLAALVAGGVASAASLAGYATTAALASCAPLASPSFSGDIVTTANVKAGTTSGGYYCKAGTSGSYGNIFNFNWTGSSYQAWIDGTFLGNLTYTSDARYKQQVEPLADGALDRVMALRPVSYRWQDKGIFKDDNQTHEGFLAQEVLAVIASGVSGDPAKEDSVLSVNLLPLVSVLTKAVQELAARVQQLEARAAA